MENDDLLSNYVKSLSEVFDEDLPLAAFYINLFTNEDVTNKQLQDLCILISEAIPEDTEEVTKALYGIRDLYLNRGMKEAIEEQILFIIDKAVDDEESGKSKSHFIELMKKDV